MAEYIAVFNLGAIIGAFVVLIWVQFKIQELMEQINGRNLE